MFGITLKYFSEFNNIIVNGSGGWIHIKTPHLFQNLLPAYHLPLSVNKQFYKHDLPFGKGGDRTFGIPYLVG